MPQSKLIIAAWEFANRHHFDQKRKYTGEHYIVHLEEVAQLVKDHDGTEEQIAAALLHDVVEDTDVTLGEVEAEFGPEVADLVYWLTDVSKPIDGNRKTRKEIDRAHIAEASPEAKTIKLADLISNSRSIVEHDPDFAKVYLEEKHALLQVLTEGNAELYKIATKMVHEGYFKLNMPMVSP